MTYRIIVGDAREKLREISDGSARCCVTSPPYWGLRDYGADGQIGLEESPEEFVEQLVGVFREVRRVLTDDGTLWVNLGDSYAGARGGPQGVSGVINDRSVAKIRCRQRKTTRVADGIKSKDLVGIPWMVAFALRADGWFLRSDIIWAKPNPMPESVIDRPTKSHEYLFLFSKSERYHYDAAAIREPFANGVKGATPWGQNDRERNRGGRSDGLTAGTGTGWKPSADGRNRRSVWTIATRPFPGAHFATYPPELVEPCVLAGSARGDTIIDPFNGAGTTGIVALRHDRHYVGIEINPEYAEMARTRIDRERAAGYQEGLAP